MANQLGMDKSLAVQNLRNAGFSERRIAQTLGISRGAVRRHLAAHEANSTKAQTGSAQTGSEESNGTRAQTGSGDAAASPEALLSFSQCQAFREVILSKLEQGLSAKRIFQDLVHEHGFDGKYWSVYRFVKKLGQSVDSGLELSHLAGDG